MCYLGSKSLSHLLSQVEKRRDRLLSIGAQSEPARRQIISSVMEYWHEKPGIGVNIVDKLLNYTILTPNSVILWALNDQLGKGEGLVHNYAFELVSGTVAKVTNRVRQIVGGRKQPGLSDVDISVLDETLRKERGEMNNLFAVIEDALVGVATGSVDEMAESADQDERGEAILRGWGARWLRVFRRKMAVEEAWIEETLKQDVRREDQDMNGVVAAPVADGGSNGSGIEGEGETAKGEDLDEIL